MSECLTRTYADPAAADLAAEASSDTFSPHTHRVTLPSGTLSLTLKQSALPLEDLLDFAVRRNPKRGFLFVSRVLGKHIPVSPATAQQTYTALAAALPALEQPHFIGLAETATALGEGVFRAWQDQQHGVLLGKRGTFQTTTRYLTRRPMLLRFDEPHSHAPAHILYDPGPVARQATELVLIDDELSTGTTLQNLAAAWLAQHPQVRRVVLVSLTDWCPRRAELAATLGVPTDFVSLSRGHFEFWPNPQWPQPTLPAVTGNGADKTELLAACSPRYGDLPPLPDPAALGLDVTCGERVLVLGSGEYQYPAYALALALAQQGAAAAFSATTRSPILPGLAIHSSLTFNDSVRDGIPNFLYNVQPDQWDRIVLTYEGRCSPDPHLITVLGGHAQALCLDAPLPKEALSTLGQVAGV